MYQQITIVGNVGQTPEIRTLDSGVKLASFSIATSKKWKDKVGQKQEKTTWFNCTVFGNLSDVVEKFVKKGDKLFLQGEINIDEYEKDGVKKIAVKVIVQNLVMLGSQEQIPNTPHASTQKPASTQPPVYEDDMDDLPF